MNNIKLINCIVILLIQEVQCTVVLLAVKEEFNNSAQVTFSCYLSIGSHDCSAEFLYNKQTLDTLRSSKGKCYHKLQLCSRERCSCSQDCNTFILIITNQKYKNGDIVGCEVQHINDEKILSTTEEILYNGSVFQYYKTHVSTVAKPDRDSSTSSTAQGDMIESKTDEHVNLIILAVLPGLLIIGIVVFVWIRRKKCQGRRENISQGQINEIHSADRLGNISQSRPIEIPFERLENISQSRPHDILFETTQACHQNLQEFNGVMVGDEIKTEGPLTRNRIQWKCRTDFQPEPRQKSPHKSPRCSKITRPLSLPGISTKGSHEYLNITRPRPLPAISTDRDPHAYLNITGPRPFSATPTKVSHENLNSTQPRPIVAISTEESHMNINFTRSRRLASISTEKSHEYLNITRPRPVPSISTNRESHEYLNITRPRPVPAISTKESLGSLNSTQSLPLVAISTEESQMNINSTRSRRLASISTEEFRVNLTRTRPSSFSATGAKRYLKKKRSASYSAMSAKDSNSTSDDSIWTISSAESYRNFNKARPGSFSTTDSSKNVNSSLLSISSAVSVNSTTSIGSGVPLMDEVTHL